jgi:hypothetical protein
MNHRSIGPRERFAIFSGQRPIIRMRWLISSDDASGVSS